jgi:hypothetical protein
LCYLGAHGKLQNPTTTPSVRISNEPGGEKEEREKNALYSGHLRLCQQPRAAHALRSDQLENSSGSPRFPCWWTFPAIRKTRNQNPLSVSVSLFICRKTRWPIKTKKKLSSIWVFLYSKRPVRPHSYNKANDELI